MKKNNSLREKKWLIAVFYNAMRSVSLRKRWR